MELLLKRRPPDGKRTHGDLFVDETWQCNTIEDVVREEKIAGETAIPAGRYQVIVSHSPRFKKQLPLLLRVPNFTGVRIHAGNSEGDTEGCILVGQTRALTSIGNSRAALEDLMVEIDGALQNGEQVWITVENAKGDSNGSTEA